MIDGLPKGSLLAYLKSATSRFHLHIMTVGPSEQIPDAPLYPFRVCDTSSPFAAIVEGQIRTDACHAMLPVFLLIQKDHYAFQATDLQPIDNRLLEKSWQTVLAFADQQDVPQNAFLLSDQQGPGGELRPYRSLFFCRVQETYFHPLCPSCGSLLELCQDDHLLASAGLKAYSSSLKRYLFCPACQQGGRLVVYYSFAMSPEDPGHVKDRFDLFRGFGQLKTRSVQDPSFPCPACPSFSECYGPAENVTRRIVAFSFYPFYMLMQKAASLKAVDFLALLSGAGFAAVQKHLMEKRCPGRLARVEDLSRRFAQATAFLFPDSDRLFAEVLYLKLSFLETLTQLMIKTPRPALSWHLGLSWESIWVRLGEQNSGLPYLWSFDLTLINPLQALEREVGLAVQTSGGQVHFLALTWFYVLLANQGQGIFDILGQMAKRLGSGQDLRESTGTAAGKESAWAELPIFRPENIFWAPDDHRVSGRWIPFWRRALELGLGLWPGAKPEVPASWPEQKLLPAMQRLKGDLKKALFEIESSPRMEDRDMETRAIAQIMRSIEQKWSVRPAATRDERGEAGGTEDIVSHTVLLAPRAVADPGQGFIAAGEKEPGSPQNAEETMVLPSPVQPLVSRAEPARPESQPAQTMGLGSRTPLQSQKESATDGRSETLEKTLVLDAQKTIHESTLATPQSDLNLAETVFYSQEGRQGSVTDAGKGLRDDSRHSAEGRQDDELDATVIMRGKQDKEP